MLGSPVFDTKPKADSKNGGPIYKNGMKRNSSLKFKYNGDLNGEPLLHSAPVLGGPQFQHSTKRTTAIPPHLANHIHLSNRLYKSSSICSFDDSPMLVVEDTHDSGKHRAKSPLATTKQEKDVEKVVPTDTSDATENEQLCDDDSDRSSDSSDDEVARIPNGGYGWVVVFASFCMQALVGGIAYVQGLMYPYFQEAMNSDKVTTAWACSMQMSVWFTGGLIAGPLVQVYGARKISMLGTLVVSLGLFISAFAQHIWMLYVFYGFLCGFGMSMIFFPAVIIVQHYFTTKRSIAVAFANAGCPFGAFIYPILVSYLLNTYGWRGELIILSAVTLHGLIFASFFHPVFKKKPKKPDSEKKGIANNSRVDDRTVTEVIISSVASLGQADITPKEKSKVKDFLKHLLDLSLWRNPNMVFDVFAYGLFAFGFIMPSMFLPLKASENDIPPPKPEIMLSVLGFSDVIGRLTSGLIGRFLGRKRLLIYGGGMVICGVATVLSSFLSNFGPLVVYSSIFGLCIGMSRAYSSVVVTDMLGIANLPKAYGFKMFINGICVLCSGPLAAFIFEVTHSVDFAFRTIGVIQFCGGFLVFILLILRRLGCAEVI